MQQNKDTKLPLDMDYAALPCLSAEEVEKLTRVRPATLHEAGAISGITPKALLYIYNALQASSNRAKRSAASERNEAKRQQHEKRSAASESDASNLRHLEGGATLSVREQEGLAAERLDKRIRARKGLGVTNQLELVAIEDIEQHALELEEGHEPPDAHHWME